MPIISNTSPLLNLAVINELQLLRQQFEHIIIPSMVLAELKLESSYPGTELLTQALVEEWIEVVTLKDKRLAQTLMLELDQGEAAAIALALEQGHSQLLMDERDGRAKAKAVGLQPIGILGILLRAKVDGELASVKTTLERLRSDAGFFIANDLFESILNEAGE
jgi:predicted nucleic acid-binding protein